MSELKRTVLRHRMLTAIVDGRVARARYGGRTWDIDSGASTHGAMENAITYLTHGGAARIDRDAGWSFGGPVVLTDAGSALLSEWNERYGEVQP